MPLRYDIAGYVHLPLTLITRVICVVSTLDDFYHELCVLSQHIIYAAIDMVTRTVFVDEPFLETLRETLERIENEYNGVFADLVVSFEDVSDIMDTNIVPDDGPEN